MWHRGARSTYQFRQYVQSWINEWDLIRLDPTYTPHTRINKFELDYSEF